MDTKRVNGILIILGLSFLFSSIGLSQNLVPNGGFEDYSSLPNGFSQYFKAIGWTNVNGNPQGPPFASPDYFHTLGTVPTTFGQIAPNSGAGQMGFYTYLLSLVNAREYISRQLSSPLIPGQEYQLSFYLTNGNGGIYTARIDNMAIHFSINPLVQLIDEVIQLTPTIELPGVISHPNYWQQYVLTFTATEAAEYITFGNFELDAATTVVGGTTAYYFIDDIELIPTLSSLQIQGDESICEGESATLFALNDSSFAWAESSNPTTIISTDSSIIVSPTVSSSYIVYGTSDTAYFSVNVNSLPLINLGNDTTLCTGETLILSAEGLFTNYNWQDNSSNPTYNVIGQGIYWISVSNDNCIANDSINVDFNELPIINLGIDTTLCQGQTLVLDANTSNATFLWQDNSTNQQYLATEPGTYWVDVEVNNCNSADFINVNFNELPFIDLGVDTALCAGDTLILDVTTSNATFVWNDNSTTPTFEVTEQGTYSVVVEINNCSSIDYINIILNELPIVDLGIDTALCGGLMLTLDASNSNATYLWQDNSTNPDFKLKLPGEYWVIVEVNNCSSSDTVLVTEKDCEATLELPNVFSPNNDGINDLFIPKTIDGVVTMQTVIYSRWGDKVYETDNLMVEWDGSGAAEGTYFWVISYVDIYGTSKDLKGTVTLLK